MKTEEKKLIDAILQKIDSQQGHALCDTAQRVLFDAVRMNKQYEFIEEAYDILTSIVYEREGYKKLAEKWVRRSSMGEPYLICAEDILALDSEILKKQYPALPFN